MERRLVYHLGRHVHHPRNFFGKSWEVIDEYLGWGGLVAFLLGLGLVFWFLHRKREHELEEIDPDDR